MKNNQLKGVLVGKSLPPSHLLFVDDVLLFGLGNEFELRKTLELLDTFCA